jgi:hypothetical protein
MTRRPDNPRIDDLLADSMIQAMMRADRVEPDTLRSLMDRVSGRLSSTRDQGLTKGLSAVFKPHDLGVSCAATGCW